MVQDLKRKTHKWTDEERVIIRRDFRHNRESCQRIADYLSLLTGERITCVGVKGQVQNMGIAKSDDRHPWTPKEDDKLRELIQSFCPRNVAKKMHRSVNDLPLVVTTNKELKNLPGDDEHRIGSRLLRFPASRHVVIESPEYRTWR